jgi:hypothetical protein
MTCYLFESNSVMLNQLEDLANSETGSGRLGSDSVCTGGGYQRFTATGCLHFQGRNECQKMWSTYTGTLQECIH